MSNIKSCYIHIPFCSKICSYCDFCKNFYNEDIAYKYLLMLEEEINSKYNNDILDTLYIGGGTPSCLSFKNLDMLFKIIKKIKLNSNYEFTFECNYEDINDNLLEKLKNNGVNRISIGIQTFNEKYSNFLNRNINKNKMIEKVLLTKKYFDNINVDFIYALKDETLKELEEDINIFLKLDVSHISTYSLIVEKNTKLYIDNYKELNDDVQSDMYYKIIKRLKENNYNHYEISNFSKKGCESKHNLTYWNNEEYYGFGAGASGFINNIRYKNTNSVYRYIQGKLIVKEEKLSKKQMLKDEVMLNLRKTSGINTLDFYKKYKIKFEDVFNYDTMLKNNLLEKKDNNIYIPENKLFVSNLIIIELLDTYLLE